MKNRQALGRLAALSSAVLAAAACASAGGAGGGLSALRRMPGTVNKGAFAPSRPAAQSYGPDASLPCHTNGAFQVVLDELTAVANRAARPAPETDGRVCAVAEAFLGWDTSTQIRPKVVEFTSHWFGLTSSVQPPIVAVLDTDDPKQIAERVVQAIGTPALNAVHPVVGMSTLSLAGSKSAVNRKTKIAVVLLDRGTAVDGFPRRLDAGQAATLTGTLAEGLTSPKVTVSDPAGHVTVAENAAGADFKAEVKCGDKPGTIRVEIRGQRGDQSGVLANFPVACATQLASSVSVAPEPWPTGTAEQEQKVAEILNDERAATGLPPLTWDADVAQVARQVSESLKTGGNGGDIGERLKQAGIASGLVLQSLAADRSPERAQERLASSPSNRANILNPEVNRVGVGLFATTDAQKLPLVYLAEIFVKELPPVDVAQLREKLRQAVAQKRKDARTTPVKSDTLLEETAQKFAQALAAGAGTVAKEEGDAIVHPLNAVFKTVNSVAGAKQDPLDFAEESQIVSSGKALGVGVAQGRSAVFGRNAVYVVVMIGTPRVEAKPVKATKTK